MNQTAASEPEESGRSLATRRSLLEAARRCVAHGGLTAATSRRITDEAGANLGAITYHFGSKDDLLAEALFGEIVDRVTPALDVFRPDGDPTEQLGRAVQMLTSEFETSAADTAMYVEALLHAARHPDQRRRLQELLASVNDRLSEMVSRLRDDGRVAAWVDPPAMASLLMAVANGIALQSVIDPVGPDHTAQALQFAGLLLSAAET